MRKGVLDEAGEKGRVLIYNLKKKKKPKSLKNSNVNSLHLVLARQGGHEVVLGVLGSFQKKGKKLTTEHMKCPRVLCSASSFMDPWCKEAAPTSPVSLERGSW